MDIVIFNWIWCVALVTIVGIVGITWFRDFWHAIIKWPSLLLVFLTIMFKWSYSIHFTTAKEKHELLQKQYAELVTDVNT